MRKILEYEDYTDREDLRKKIGKLVKSQAGKGIEDFMNLIKTFNTSRKHFTKEDIENLISSGAMNVFSGLLPLGEDEDKLTDEILSIKSILYNEFPYCFFDFYSEVYPATIRQNTCTTRVIKWESVKT